MQLSTMNISVEVSLMGLFFNCDRCTNTRNRMQSSGDGQGGSGEGVSVKNRNFVGQVSWTMTVLGMLISHCDGLPRQP